MQLHEMLDLKLRLPRRVFRGSWQFFFFDSDHVVDANFVEWIKSVIALERSGCACIVQLDQLTCSSVPPGTFIVDEDATAQHFRTVLKGVNHDGWVYQMSRIGCCSNSGNWSVYCERESEIAILGFRESMVLAPFCSAITELGAKSIREAIDLPISYGYSSRALSPEWKSALIREYS